MLSSTKMFFKSTHQILINVNVFAFRYRILHLKGQQTPIEMVLLRSLPFLF